MQKNAFIKKHGISGAMPQDPSSKVIMANSFAEAIDEFLSENFKGSLRVTNNVNSGEWISVTPEYSALLFKTILCYVYGRAFLSITISTEPEGLLILIESEDDLPLSETEFRQIIKTARNAKMNIDLTKRKILLTLKYSSGNHYRVYAVSFADGKRRMLSKLGEIFFCGPTLTETGKQQESESPTQDPLGTTRQRMNVPKVNKK